jgi:signal transduction histidine kinase
MPTRVRDAWLDDLAEGVVLIEDGRVTRMNTAAEEMLGADRRRVVGLPLIAALRDHRLERLWLAGGRDEIALRGRRVEAQRIEGGLALRDVSEARGAQQAARELLAVLSHELRTPATTIRSTLEALAYDDLPPDTRRRLLERAGEEAGRLVRLLDDLTVDVAPPRERSVALRPAVERACAVLDDRLREHRVEVRRALPDLSVWADPDKVLQVLVNLIENAAVHGPDEAVVDVLAEEADGWVTVAVRDRGEPLPEARIDALFAPHARGPSPKARGTGLGLYIVRSIADRWGGAAWGGRWHGDGPEGPEAGNVFAVRAPARRDVRREQDGRER